MPLLASLIDGIKWLFEQLHALVDPKQLKVLVNLWGPPWVSYLILFAIVFSETGLLVGFFLPGDSLLFAAGVLASQGVFQIDLLIATLSVAAVTGDAVNYYLGLQMEERVFEKGRIRFIKHEHLMAAKAFYERHGGKAIVLARFAPFVRTFTPFVAGVAQMSYAHFAMYNILGGVAWVTLMSLAGYWLGNVPFVASHFEIIMLGIVAVSLVPIFVGGARGWRARRDRPAA